MSPPSRDSDPDHPKRSAVARLVLLLGIACVLVPLVKGSVVYLQSMGILSLPPPGTADGSPFTLIGNPGWIYEERRVLVKTFWWTKGASDIALLTVMGLFGVMVAAGRVRLRVPREPRLALFIGTVFLAAVVALQREPWVAALGLRVFAPMALVLLASSALRKQEHFTRLVAFALGLAALIVVLTVLQRFLGVAFRTWCTQLSPDWCRAFSVYTHANILAAFLVVSFVLLLTYQGLSPAVRIVGTLSLFGAVFLTRSGIGFPSLLACGALWAATRWERSRARWGLLLFLPALGSLPALAWLTGRSNIWISVSDRVTILWRLVMEGSLTELFFGRGLGYGANTSASLSKITGMQAQDVFVADSLYISLLAQIGLLGLAAFVALNLRLLTLAWRLRGDAVADTMLVLIPVLGLLSTTTVVLEVVPINWLYWIGCGALLCRPADLQEQQQAIPPPTSDKTDGPGPGDENHVHALLGSPLQSQTHP